MKRKYCEKYDAYYDLDGKWLEPGCKSELCEFCGKRPEKHPIKCHCLQINSKKIIKFSSN